MCGGGSIVVGVNARGIARAYAVEPQPQPSETLLQSVCTLLHHIHSRIVLTTPVDLDNSFSHRPLAASPFSSPRCPRAARFARTIFSHENAGALARGPVRWLSRAAPPRVRFLARRTAWIILHGALACNASGDIAYRLRRPRRPQG